MVLYDAIYDELMLLDLDASNNRTLRMIYKGQQLDLPHELVVRIITGDLVPLGDL